MGSGYESDSESAVSCCTDDILNDYLGNVYGESSDLEREVDGGSDSAAADSLGSPRVNGVVTEDREGASRCLLTEEAELVSGPEQEALIKAPTSTQSLPIVSLTPAGASDTEIVRERLMQKESSEHDQFDRQVHSVSGSPNNSLDLLSLDPVLDQRSGSESSDREDSTSSRRLRNPFLSSSPLSEFTLRQRRRSGEKKEAGNGSSTSGKRGEEVPTFTLAIVSRRSRHRAGQYHIHVPSNEQPYM